MFGDGSYRSMKVLGTGGSEKYCAKIFVLRWLVVLRLCAPKCGRTSNVKCKENGFTLMCIF
jgi:hypothetical protein